MNRRKILHVIDSFEAGGAERLVVEVICGLPHTEHHVIVLNGPETLKGELPANCRFTNLNRKSKWEVYKNARELKRYILQNKIDIVHSHLFFSSVTARLATPRTVPLFNSIHVISSLDNYTRNRLSLYLEKFTYRRHHYIIAVSKEVLDDFDKWVGIKGPSTVLYNFIRDEFYVNSSKQQTHTNPLRLVAVGNLRYQKNYPYLIEAFKKMPANVTLDIYGAGEMRTQLQEEIDRYQLPIRLLGSQKQLYKVLPSYDAFIMSSFFEGQPLSLLEATACGLPAILSDIPVLREVTGEHALYFDLNNPADLVEKIEKITCGRLDILKNVKPALEYISSFARKDIYLKNLSSLYQLQVQAVQNMPD